MRPATGSVLVRQTFCLPHARTAAIGCSLALQKRTESPRVERAILDEPRDRDRKAHAPAVHGEVTIHLNSIRSVLRSTRRDRVVHDSLDFYVPVIPAPEYVPTLPPPPPTFL